MLFDQPKSRLINYSFIIECPDYIINDHYGIERKCTKNKNDAVFKKVCVRRCRKKIRWYYGDLKHKLPFLSHYLLLCPSIVVVVKILTLRNLYSLYQFRIKMFKKLLISLIFLASISNSKAQVVSKAVFTLAQNQKTIESIFLRLDRTTFIIENNTLVISNNGEGRMIYYDRFDGADKEGKLKSVGDITYDYYDRFDGDDRRGKIKSVNGISINYYDRFDGDDRKGKIKSIGTMQIGYYDRFDGDSRKGKIRSLGGIQISYFDRFDGDHRSSKVKNIGQVAIDYYDRFDGGNRVGKIKSIIGNSKTLVVIESKRGF